MLPHRYAPLGDVVARCVANGREQGLGFLLDVFAEYGAPATFFIEALQTAYFGDEPMGRIVEEIVAAGHDVQLHLHPCWLEFRRADWRDRDGRRDDSCAGRSDAELDDMLRTGLAAFDRWGVRRPIALRTGGFETDLAVYRAMERAGLRLGSNVCRAAFEPHEEELRLSAGRHWIGAMLEVPVLSYRTRLLKASRWRGLAITAASEAEFETLLWQMHGAGISPVVVLTHPFEFVKKSDFRYSHLRPNRLNQRRLRRLLEFLSRERATFDVVTFADRAPLWMTQPSTAHVGDFETRRRIAIPRALHNALNDRVWGM